MSLFRSIARAAAAGGIAASLAGPAMAASCASGAELTALRTRVVQTELMVAALSCSQHPLYNEFVQKFRDPLVAQGNVLVSFFARSYGADGTPELDRFVTRLANTASQASLRVDNFCVAAEARFDQILALAPAQLTHYAALQPRADSHGIEICQAKAQATIGDKLGPGS